MYKFIPNCYNRNYNRGGNNDDDRGLFLPFLVGAAVAFPLAYIASNNKQPQNVSPVYQQPYYFQPMPYYYRPPYMAMPY